MLVMAPSLSSRRPPTIAGTGQKPDTLVAAGGDFYDCLRVCAMFDKPYIARYERKAGKLYQFVGTFKDKTKAGTGKGKPSTVVLDFDYIRALVRKERCAWCGVKSVVLCGSCSWIVCQARVTKRDGGQHFQCRKGCGGEGMITGFIETCEATKQPAPSRSPARAGLPGKETAALPSGRLRLKA